MRATTHIDSEPHQRQHVKTTPLPTDISMHEPPSPTPVRRRGRPIGSSRPRATQLPENLHEHFAQAVIAAVGSPSDDSPGVEMASLVLQLWARRGQCEVERAQQTSLLEAVKACLQRETRELGTPDRVAIRAGMLAKHLPALIEALSHARPNENQLPDAPASTDACGKLNGKSGRAR